MIYLLWILAVWAVAGPLLVAKYTRQGDKINIALEIRGDEYSRLIIGGPAVWLAWLAYVIKE